GRGESAQLCPDGCRLGGGEVGDERACRRRVLEHHDGVATADDGGRRAEDGREREHVVAREWLGLDGGGGWHEVALDRHRGLRRRAEDGVDRICQQGLQGARGATVDV